MSKPTILLGEAYGENEAKLNKGFVGPAGVELLRMLNESGFIELTAFDRDYINDYYKAGNPALLDAVWSLHPEVYRTNVFNLHPPGNRLEHFCGPKAGAIRGWPQLLTSKYVRAEFERELERLGDEILHHDPDLIICLGNTALWAMAGRTGITKLRGTTLLSSHCVSGYKLLPTYHPAAVLRQWELRPTTLADLMKASREANFPEIRRPHREIWIEPSLEDIERFIATEISPLDDPLLSVDIETSGNRVTCIGIAPTSRVGIVIPLDDSRTKNGCYWATATLEKQVWALIRRVLEDPSTRKLFQNGAYDIAFLWRAYGIKVLNASEDTMLCHHALHPEALKGLGFLGSIYADEGAWKSDRPKYKNETIKRDA